MKNNPINFRKITRNQGFSLIEMLLVLGVLAVLLIGAFVVYPKVKAQNQANEMATHMTMIKANVQKSFLSQASYKGLDTTTANKARSFPESMNGGDFAIGHSGIRSPWGGIVYVDGINAVTPTPNGNIPVYRSFYIRLADIPSDICMPLLSSVAGHYESIKVGTTELLDKSGLNTSLAAQTCANSQPQTIIFYST